MLDQKPDRPTDPDAPSNGDDHDLFEEVARNDYDPPADGSGGGGVLGRWRAGMAAPPRGPEHKPMWRRILVFFFKWGAIAAMAFVPLSAAAVFIIGWTGPPPTFNMAGTAMQGIEVRKTWAPLKDVSPHIVRAIIAAEDQSFCLHDGFDAKEIRKAIDEAERGRRVRGASTISQQTAKNVFLFNGGGWVRKGFETWFTFLMENMWSKPRIMETYLNIAEWGDGIYGIEAASQERYGVSSKNLTQRQAAALAAVLPNPNRWKVDGSYASGRRNSQIQTLMGVVRRDGLDDCVVK